MSYAIREEFTRFFIFAFSPFKFVGIGFSISAFGIFGFVEAWIKMWLMTSQKYKTSNNTNLNSQGETLNVYFFPFSCIFFNLDSGKKWENVFFDIGSNELPLERHSHSQFKFAFWKKTKNCKSSLRRLINMTKFKLLPLPPFPDFPSLSSPSGLSRSRLRCDWWLLRSAKLQTMQIWTRKARHWTFIFFHFRAYSSIWILGKNEKMCSSISAQMSYH